VGGEESPFFFLNGTLEAAVVGEVGGVPADGDETAGSAETGAPTSTSADMARSERTVEEEEEGGGAKAGRSSVCRLSEKTTQHTLMLCLEFVWWSVWRERER